MGMVLMASTWSWFFKRPAQGCPYHIVITRLDLIGPRSVMTTRNKTIAAYAATTFVVACLVGVLLPSGFSATVVIVAAVLAAVAGLVTHTCLAREGEEFFTVRYPQGNARVWVLRMADDLT